ncbi:sigma-70 family RNA polymerase sigma factor [Paenibacillus sp. 2TAB23]|uniref:sigma-70 family RNA polymerase sigma factor n=1 Tax=Paenibacillus sp. 2TAB23 TaxID=3233004 RepID=UPI003F99E24C
MERFPEHLHPLVTENLGMVRQIARRMSYGLRDPAMDYDDLFSAGSIGLMFAAQHYDESKGYAFSSYAYRCIWGYAARSINTNGQIRVPTHIKRLANRIRIGDLYDVNSEELASRFNSRVEYINSAKHYLEIRLFPILLQVEGETVNLADLYATTSVDLSVVYTQEFVESLPLKGKYYKRRALLDLMLQGLNAKEAGKRLGFSRQAAHVHLKAVREEWDRYQKNK